MPKLTEARLLEIIDELKKRPTLHSIEKEAGLNQATLTKIKSGRLNLNEDYIQKLEPVLKKHKIKF